MKRFLVVSFGFLLILVFGGMKLFGVNFYPTGTIPGNVENVLTYNIKNGKWILFEHKNSNYFGIAKVKKFGPIYFYNGGTDYYEIEDRMPFSVAGYGEKNGDFMVAVKIPSGSNIKYISVGNHLEEGKHLEQEDPLNETISLDIVQQYPDSYLVREVEGNYVFFLTNGYSEQNWTVRGFDEDGKLVADKLFGSQPRYLQ
ncbi:hypothetical protein [Chengkuizengella marina]|uniref:Uncharacterized protein n=1 Tax=Chengkuizengella marina TaxID=2507566 RepID=A0A6N9Q1B3_9BACL|nr:hypothetical protein [Chengkuizengella marina]NBI29046.1 hypothetical protein [Chengkuizengella marina]